jgi:hypothetical protein
MKSGNIVQLIKTYKKFPFKFYFLLPTPIYFLGGKTLPDYLINPGANPTYAF